MENASILIRKGDISDAEAVCRARVESWKAAYKPFFSTSFLTKLDPLENIHRLEQKLRGPPESFSLLIAELDNHIIGFCISDEPRYPTQSNTIELQGLYVVPRYWRIKTGKKLVEQCVMNSCQKGYDWIELWCLKGNTPAERAYENFGFSLTGKERQSAFSKEFSVEEVQYRKRLDHRTIKSPLLQR